MKGFNSNKLFQISHDCAYESKIFGKVCPTIIKLTFLNIQNNCEKPLSKAFFLICHTSSGDGQKGGHAGKGDSIFIGGVESKGGGKYPAEPGGFSCFGA